ncbi:TadE family protein [Paenalcaligenes suwonensis]|uniref:TadE family protein n=1 Tax=Paenalcaligenes suwonensis TaxID=1202713 RepID=UPI00140CBDC1|nr:TadE family protein [Paenalcaligenes suwonensis]NHC61259.1 pilus assembly protein [Paenalcaligenes suwonensis]
MPFHSSPPHAKQAGSSSIEFLLIASVFCALLVLCYDATRAWMLRQVLLLALQESGRNGVTQHLEPTTMQQHFDRAAAAWWPSAAHQQRYYQRFASRYGFDPWRIWQLSPSDQDFTQHEDKMLSQRSSQGYKQINVHHQLAQHLHHSSSSPQQSIFTANTLHTQLIYWYEPSLALSRAVLRLLWPSDIDPYLQQGKSQGLLPIRLHFSLPMQSHPIQWPLSPHSAIQRVAGSNSTALAWQSAASRSFMAASNTPSDGNNAITPLPPTPPPTDEHTPTAPDNEGTNDFLSEETACEGATCCY